MTRLGSNGSSVPAISMFMLSHRQQSSNLIVNMETTKKWNMTMVAKTAVMHLSTSGIASFSGFGELLTQGICLSSETNNTVSYFDWYSECDVSTQVLVFQVSTALYTFPIPIFALLVGQTLAYLIQKWAFGGFIYQWAIASIHLLCSLQLGRSIMIALVILTCVLIGPFLLKFALLSHQCAARKRKTNDRKNVSAETCNLPCTEELTIQSSIF